VNQYIFHRILNNRKTNTRLRPTNKGKVWALQQAKEPVGLRVSVLASHKVQTNKQLNFYSILQIGNCFGGV